MYVPSLSVGFCIAAVMVGLRVGSTIEARRLSSGTFLSSSNRATEKKKYPKKEKVQIGKEGKEGRLKERKKERKEGRKED